MNHTGDNWLAVFDAAESPQKVTPVAAVNATNADAVQLNNTNHTVIAFSHSASTLPISIRLSQPGEAYIAGLNPKTNYTVVFGGGMLTIASDDGTHRMMSTEAGVLRVAQP